LWIIDPENIGPTLERIAASIAPPKPRTAKPPIRADESDVLLDQFSIILDQAKVHGLFCRCDDCGLLWEVKPRLLRKFEPTILEKPLGQP